ncbi:uncharacterized protein METZ01_LOCUS106961 [marine metagenome]|uniref:Uncharacterized protein n=1 Tax=marine metagenome TaxID=408172 RepID=A0A381WQ67_9ZZZZ
MAFTVEGHKERNYFKFPFTIIDFIQHNG